MTIEVPANLVAALEQCIARVAESLGEDTSSPALRRIVERALLTRGMRSLNDEARSNGEPSDRMGWPSKPTEGAE
jgi:hypothetical protein